MSGFAWVTWRAWFACKARDSGFTWVTGKPRFASGALDALRASRAGIASVPRQTREARFAWIAGTRH
jgi:hypothetical protein